MPLKSQLLLNFKILRHIRNNARQIWRSNHNSIYVKSVPTSSFIIDNNFRKKESIISPETNFIELLGESKSKQQHNSYTRNILTLLRLISSVLILTLLKSHYVDCEDVKCHVKHESDVATEKSNISRDKCKKNSSNESSSLLNDNTYTSSSISESSKQDIEAKQNLDHDSHIKELPPKRDPAASKENNVQPENRDGTKEPSKGGKDASPDNFNGDKLETPKNHLCPPFYQELDKTSPLSLRDAIHISKIIIRKKLDIFCAPGISVMVSVNGKTLWADGFGFADVENGVRMFPFSVMRIASISKSLTMVAVAKLVEEGKLDLDAPVQKYVPYFPKKFVDGEEVTITTRHLLSHTSGIRHYSLKSEIDAISENNAILKKEKEELEQVNPEPALKPEERRERLKRIIAKKALSREEQVVEKKDGLYDEFYLKEKFNSVKESLQLFQDDELLFKPGEDFHYTSHGWTLVSAVVEGAAGKPFTKVITNLIHSLSLQNTYLDKNEPIIHSRARFYTRDNNGKLRNAPYVDNSYKWAGGGLLSNVTDLVSFGNAMLYSYQNACDKRPLGFLESSTMKEMWSIWHKGKSSTDMEKGYGLGWGVVEDEDDPRAFAHNRKFYAYHTGGAVGASSVLLIMPTQPPDEPENCSCTNLPQGVVVAIITNLENVPLSDIALKIALVFRRVRKKPNVVGSIHGGEKHKLYNLDEF